MFFLWDMHIFLHFALIEKYAGSIFLALSSVVSLKLWFEVTLYKMKMTKAPKAMKSNPTSLIFKKVPGELEWAEGWLQFMFMHKNLIGRSEIKKCCSLCVTLHKRTQPISRRKQGLDSSCLTSPSPRDILLTALSLLLTPPPPLSFSEI